MLLNCTVLNNRRRWVIDINISLYLTVDILITDPLFDSEESHMVLPAIDIKIDTHIIIEFKPLNVTGLLFYSTQHTTEYSGDFIAMSIIDGFILVSMSMGHELPLVLRSTNQSVIGLCYVSTFSLVFWFKNISIGSFIIQAEIHINTRWVEAYQGGIKIYMLTWMFIDVIFYKWFNNS